MGVTQALSFVDSPARFNPPPALVWGNTMNPNYLDFEQPIAELEMKIEELQGVGDGADLNLGDEIDRLREKSTALTAKIYADLSAWDIVRVARHPQRPYSLDYIPKSSPNSMSYMAIATSPMTRRLWVVLPASTGARSW